MAKHILTKLTNFNKNDSDRNDEVRKNQDDEDDIEDGIEDKIEDDTRRRAHIKRDDIRKKQNKRNKSESETTEEEDEDKSVIVRKSSRKTGLKKKNKTYEGRSRTKKTVTDDSDDTSDTNDESKSETEEKEQKNEGIVNRNKFSDSLKFAMSFRDVEDSISTFSGEDDYSFRVWLEDFEETAC